MSQYSDMRTWSCTALDLYNRLHRNPSHANCDLVIKTSYKSDCFYALYCTNHDFFMGWISEDDFDWYQKSGVNVVSYPDKDEYNFYSADRPLCSFDQRFYDFTTPKTVKVKNLRSGKKVDLWIPLKGQPFRDPSMPEYWKFIDSFK